MLNWREVHDLADLQTSSKPEDEIETVTPMRLASVVCLDEDGNRRTLRMRWGFAARNAKDPTGRPEHIHARAETIDVLPTFREAFAHARGLVIVNTFNEGEEISPSKTIQHVITPRDDKPMAIAVVWERWTNRNEGELYTFVMATVPANKLISRITDRMPAIVQPADWAKWLGEEPASLAELKAMLVPHDGDWDMQVARKPPPPQKPGAQGDLF